MLLCSAHLTVDDGSPESLRVRWARIMGTASLCHHHSGESYSDRVKLSCDSTLVIDTSGEKYQTSYWDMYGGVWRGIKQYETALCAHCELCDTSQALISSGPTQHRSYALVRFSSYGLWKQKCPRIAINSMLLRPSAYALHLAILSAWILLRLQRLVRKYAHSKETCHAHRASNCTMRLVLCLYRTRCPHCLQRIGSPRFRGTSWSQSPHL
ncbi:uncharacterized protein EKO05_0001457 [Ascochyta rabiei]|uniref:uncharacterized protein n=1 Tax=Didymella rabiei TaxID=5454 RepID=UPI0022055015|nr:uncharacterized protein EKO05_0001457 [Ascochyta rabiei]UPX10819.1 hypothetical protein EKO05_0001457 [Ascochyta rabiei]